MNRIRLLALACLLATPALAQDSFGGAPTQAPPDQQPWSTPAPQNPPPTYPPQGGPYPPQGQPAPAGYPAQPGGGWGQPAKPPAGNDAIARMMQAERQDMGVPPTGQLRSGPMHAPTPNQLPGGQLITTPELVQLLQNPNSGVLVFDVLGGPQMLPNAIPVVPASQGGSFDDQVQRDFGNYLQQVTQGRKDRPMVFYCQSSQCWMSYNAALRATRLGYTNVLWYRGGIEAWQQAGLPLQGAGGPAAQPQQPPSGQRQW